MGIRYMLVLILCCALVTWVPRIAPFILAKKMDFPPRIIKFLDYLPICIIFALVIANLIGVSEGEMIPTIKWDRLLIAVPVSLIAYRTKDMMLTVITGVIGMALLRYFFL